MANLKNLATGTVLTAPSPATSGTSLVLQSGEGTAMPAANFYAIAHPDGSYPTAANAEIVLVTNVSTDTLTITRAQLSTTAKSISTSWRISNPFLKEDYDAKQDLNSNLTTIAGLTATTDNFLQAKSSAWASRTVAQVKSDLGLTGTNSGDQTSIVGITGTTAQFNTAITDNDFATLAGSESITNKTFDSTSPTAFFFPGMTVPYPVPTETAPTGWLLANGQAVSRTTYATLFNLIMPSLGTVTTTIATPAVVTKTAHGLKDGDAFHFTTSGALPTGFTANTIYYVTRVDANTFKLSTTTGGVGVLYINTTGSQSGTHTGYRSPYGLGDGSTTFNVPDLRGRAIAGVEDMGSVGTASRLTGFANAPPNPKAIGNVGGLETHTLLTAQMPSHTHTVSMNASSTAGGLAQYFAGNGAGSSSPTSSSTGGDGAHNNVQPTILMNWLIKT